MTIKFFLGLSMLMCGFFFGQQKTYPSPKPEVSTSPNDSTTIAQFPSGEISFRNLVANNSRLKKLKTVKECSAIIRFIVEKDGSISNIQAESDNEICKKEFILAVQKIKTKWIPARAGTIPLRSVFRFPIHYKIS